MQWFPLFTPYPFSVQFNHRALLQNSLLIDRQMPRPSFCKTQILFNPDRINVHHKIIDLADLQDKQAIMILCVRFNKIIDHRQEKLILVRLNES